MEAVVQTSNGLPTSMDLDIVTPEKMKLHVAPDVQFIELSYPKRRLAYRHLPGKSPTLLYVPGFLSTMEIYKVNSIKIYYWLIYWGTNKEEVYNLRDSV